MFSKNTNADDPRGIQKAVGDFNPPILLRHLFLIKSLVVSIASGVVIYAANLGGDPMCKLCW